MDNAELLKILSDRIQKGQIKVTFGMVEEFERECVELTCMDHRTQTEHVMTLGE